MTACSIRAWPLRVSVGNPASRGSMRVDVRAVVRASCVRCIARLGGDCVVRAPCCVRLGLCVKLCMRVCEDLPPSLRFRTASSCEAS